MFALHACIHLYYNHSQVCHLHSIRILSLLSNDNDNDNDNDKPITM